MNNILNQLGGSVDLHRIVSKLSLLVIIVSAPFGSAIKTNHLVAYPSYAGAGELLGVSHVASIVLCAAACGRTERCTAVNYRRRDGQCTLLQPHGHQYLWQKDPDTTYYCMDCEHDINMQASIGFWKMTDPIRNTYNTSSMPVVADISFLPAVAGSPVSVATFHGTASSYISIPNDGDVLAVTSFTWMVDLYPEDNLVGPLFNWHVESDTMHGKYGSHIWYLQGMLFFKVVHHGVYRQVYPYSITTTTAVLNTWNTAAVSYDSSTGRVQLAINGVVEEFDLGLTGPHSTSGPVRIGYRYPENDPRYFKGKLACMRLWNVWMDLETLSTKTPLCPYK